MTCCLPTPSHGPLTRCVKLKVAHAPGMPGTFSPPMRFSDPGMHHGTCVTHVPWCMPESLTCDFHWSRRRGKRSRHSRRMRNPQFCVSGKRPNTWTNVQLHSFKGIIYEREIPICKTTLNIAFLKSHRDHLSQGPMSYIPQYQRDDLPGAVSVAGVRGLLWDAACLCNVHGALPAKLVCKYRQVYERLSHFTHPPNSLPTRTSVYNIKFRTWINNYIHVQNFANDY